MALTEKQVATYQDLVDNVINTIVGMCCNIDAFSPSVPQEWQTGADPSPIEIGFKTSGTIDNYQGAGRNKFKSEDVTATVTFKLKDKSLVKVVKRETVIKDFNDFMQSRGISSGSDTEMSVKGIVNFIANAAAFIQTRLTALSSEKSDFTLVFYNSSNKSYPTVTNKNEVDSTFNDVYISQMLNALNSTSKFETLMYDIDVSCCSSSSSSCSSSCSSSSCSSSSWFIAFMEL